MSTKSKKVTKNIYAAVSKTPASVAPPVTPSPPLTPQFDPVQPTENPAVDFNDEDLLNLDLDNADGIRLDLETGELIDDLVLVPDATYLAFSGTAAHPTITVSHDDKSTDARLRTPVPKPESVPIKAPVHAEADTIVDVTDTVTPALDALHKARTPASTVTTTATPPKPRTKAKVSAADFLIDARHTHLKNSQVPDPDIVHVDPTPTPQSIQDMLQRRVHEEYSQILTAFWRDGGPTPHWPPYGYQSYSRKTPSACPLFYPKWLIQKDRIDERRAYSRPYDPRRYEPYRSSRLRPEPTLEQEISAAVEKYAKQSRRHDATKSHTEENPRYTAKARGMVSQWDNA